MSSNQIRRKDEGAAWQMESDTEESGRRSGGRRFPRPDAFLHARGYFFGVLAAFLAGCAAMAVATMFGPSIV